MQIGTIITLRLLIEKPHRGLANAEESRNGLTTPLRSLINIQSALLIK